MEYEHVLLLASICADPFTTLETQMDVHDSVIQVRDILPLGGNPLLCVNTADWCLRWSEMSTPIIDCSRHHGSPWTGVCVCGVC